MSADLGIGTRLLDEGGTPTDEEAYEGEVLCIFAVDPGVSTGWSALKVPVRLLGQGTVARTLARCRYLGGTIRRSVPVAPSGGGGSYSSTDSRHVSDILGIARQVYDLWMPEWVECRKCDGRGGPEGFDGYVGDACRSCEGDGGGWDTEHPENFSFVFVLEGFDLRNESMDPSLLAPVRVNSILLDRLAQAGSSQRVFFQSPSDGKVSVTDDRLRRWGFWEGKTPHERDATRHAILMLRRFAASSIIREVLYTPDPLSSQEEGKEG